MRIWGMRTGIAVHVNPTDRERLQVIVEDRNSPQKHVWRARIVLATADGLGTMAIMRRGPGQQDRRLATGRSGSGRRA